MRRAAILRTKIARDRQIAAAAVPPVIFGSKALLRQRPTIHSNDLEGLAVWRRKWAHEGGDVRLQKQHAACPKQGIEGVLLTPGSDYIPYL